LIVFVRNELLAYSWVPVLNYSGNWAWFPVSKGFSFFNMGSRDEVHWALCTGSRALETAYLERHSVDYVPSTLNSNPTMVIPSGWGAVDHDRNISISILAYCAEFGCHY